jgi:hypothetical protein
MISLTFLLALTFFGNVLAEESVPHLRQEILDNPWDTWMNSKVTITTDSVPVHVTGGDDGGGGGGGGDEGNPVIAPAPPATDVFHGQYFEKYIYKGSYCSGNPVEILYYHLYTCGKNGHRSISAPYTMMMDIPQSDGRYDLSSYYFQDEQCLQPTNDIRNSHLISHNACSSYVPGYSMSMRMIPHLPQGRPTFKGVAVFLYSSKDSCRKGINPLEVNVMNFNKCIPGDNGDTPDHIITFCSKNKFLGTKFSSADGTCTGDTSPMNHYKTETCNDDGVELSSIMSGIPNYQCFN